MGLVAEYYNQLKALLPVGKTWPQEEGSVLSGLMQGGAPELARAHARFDRLVEEADPRTALEMLTDWERVVGLPDTCSEEGNTIQQRRNAVLFKLTAKWGQDITFFMALAERLGATITITEYRPFICGLSHLGADALNGSASCRRCWHVQVTEQRVTWFRCGASQCGTDPLARIDYAEELECWLKRLAPSHTILTVGYGG